MLPRSIVVGWQLAKRELPSVMMCQHCSELVAETHHCADSRGWASSRWRARVKVWAIQTWVPTRACHDFGKGPSQVGLICGQNAEFLLRQHDNQLPVR